VPECVQLTIRISRELLERLERHAERRRCSSDDVVVRALDLLMAAEKPESPAAWAAAYKFIVSMPAVSGRLELRQVGSTIEIVSAVSGEAEVLLAIVRDKAIICRPGPEYNVHTGAINCTSDR
jgi:hypothetical protein